jgi:hypothetical protein
LTSMLLFCGLVSQNPYYNLKTLSVGGLLMSGQMYYTKLRGYP